LNDVPSTLEWFEQCEGRRSERSRRLTFLMLFGPDGKPGRWLLLLAVVSAVVVGLGLGGI
jgi:hypothetical protein